MPERPRDEEEMQIREAIGVIRASRFVRMYAHSHRSITFETVCEIHNEIFKDAWAEIAGRYRDENLEITGSEHLPPHHSQAQERIKNAEKELVEHLESLKTAEGTFFNTESITDETVSLMDSIIETAALLHHTITHIHPFREGNGRTARLAANLILERYGLVGISIRVEKENKNRYHEALVQADKRGDYEPLKDLIYEGLMERYNGAALRYYDYKKH